ncbi:MAG TPA: TonB family protein [Candidatus Solibacter sp.]|nr:TonB family protein [Candidatus Solibacter sp.]
MASRLEFGNLGPCMHEYNKSSRSGRQMWVTPPPPPPGEHRQYRLMMGALALLLIALGLVLYRDRDFWFPDTDDADDSVLQTLPVMASTDTTRNPTTSIRKVQTTATKPRRTLAEHRTQAPSAATPPVGDDQADPPPVTISERTVLPPLEVEVVAGDVHQTVHVESKALHVDLQPNQQPAVDAPAPAEGNEETAAGITANVAEHVQMSADTDAIVSQSVEPAYPLLARQMKVQGAVILQAFISRDGTIDDLRVLSGPPILANAAQEAVKQWHFKPHYQGSDSVETQAKITVNFTISTN